MDWKAFRIFAGATFLGIFLLVLFLTGCATPKPALRAAAVPRIDTCDAGYVFDGTMPRVEGQRVRFGGDIRAKQAVINGNPVWVLCKADPSFQGAK